LPGDEGEVTEARREACRKLLQETFEFALREFERKMRERARVECLEASLGESFDDLRNRYLAIKSEFDRVRATRFWKLREAAVKTVRKLRGR
jgi:hypothetical protein